MLKVTASDIAYIFSISNLWYDAILFFSKCLFPLATQKFPAGNIFLWWAGWKIGNKVADFSLENFHFLWHLSTFQTLWKILGPCSKNQSLSAPFRSPYTALLKSGWKHWEVLRNLLKAPRNHLEFLLEALHSLKKHTGSSTWGLLESLGKSQQCPWKPLGSLVKLFGCPQEEPKKLLKARKPQESTYTAFIKL